MEFVGETFPGESWQVFSQVKAIDIAIGPNGILWIVDVTNTAMGWNWDSSAWVSVPGISFTSISVDTNGDAWGVATNEDIYRFIPSMP